MKHRLTEDAGQDILNIRRYTVKTWGRAQSTAYNDGLAKAFALLAANPNLGLDRAHDIEPGVRSFACGSHIIYYTITDTSVVIFGILHQNMNPQHHLPRRLSDNE